MSERLIITLNQESFTKYVFGDFWDRKLTDIELDKIEENARMQKMLVDKTYVEKHCVEVYEAIPDLRELKYLAHWTDDNEIVDPH